jgi:hypothetical protein
LANVLSFTLKNCSSENKDAEFQDGANITNDGMSAEHFSLVKEKYGRIVFLMTSFADPILNKERLSRTDQP